eukprot:CAMPEP_0202968314 /NCGR_PEP_ID=MMETSP1396-20130829/13571_1 /ASSEMBLY_ACC=CAM_ASM_000872 /TAXON_ID= /ORGANISM="Pseudokeronopsis sp., Strain Brazil" /LENGTH=299 /DNA_ID=CAMNT_0049694489 /DNA_START=464 /DNA_END=1360 /DNA_ORIENTATION=-
MPTWSQEELQFVNCDVDNWYERFVTFGGVPRYVLWNGNGTDPSRVLEEALSSKGAVVAEYFFTKGFGDIDPNKSYMLVHINPPFMPDKGDWDYLGLGIHSFASYEIFKRLSMSFESYMLSNSCNLFTTGAAKNKLGAGSAGNLFENIVLWLRPIAEETITLKALSNSEERIELTLPSSQILPTHWKANKTEDRLNPGYLYKPRTSNLESGDCFCVVEHNGGYWLLVLQMTVASTHPVKVNGLKEIVLAYSLEVQYALTRKLIVFVIPQNGELRTLQPLHTQTGKVAEVIPAQVEGFEQF